MSAYFDSSVLLSLLIGDAHAARAYELWTHELERVSSILLEIECTTVLRRLPPESFSSAARRAAQNGLELALSEVTLEPVDEDVASLARSTAGLAPCRTLDATHMATALFFLAGADRELRFCTFDACMADNARRVGREVSGPD
jgi:predicted nucleic acid-binding protein